MYQELITLDQDRPTDRLDYAFVAMRLDRWDDVKSLSRSFPQGMDTRRRHLIDAMVADQEQDWEAADQAYARAEKLSPEPGRCSTTGASARCRAAI